MSPASQTGNFHVDRYIGSYLISNTSNRNGHKILDYDGSGGQAKPSSKHPQFIGGPNIYRGGYGPTDAMYCPPPFCQNRSNWAGIPLISTANSRRNGKILSPPTRQSPHSPPFQHQRMHIVHPPPCNIEYVDGQNLPLSKLALHARGAPLILSRRYNNNGNRKQNHIQNSRPNTHIPQVTNNLEASKKVIRDIPKENRFEFKDHAPVSRTSSQNGLTLNIDSLSVASDESSGSAHSETCLPRIIKPRKRRKKDRKPLNNTTPDKPAVNDSKTDTLESVVNSSTSFSSSQDKIDINHNSSSFKPLEINSNTDYAQLYDNSKNDFYNEWKFLNPQIEFNSPPLSKQTNSKPAHVDEDESDDSSSLFEAISRCSPTVCQCRYCDPSGQLWDIDQHCYSPNLRVTAPESAIDSNKNVLLEKDTVLRRSWSEPCPGYSVENLRISDIGRRTTPHHSNPNISSLHELESKDKHFKSVGVIGAGRRNAESTKTANLSGWKQETSPKFEIVPGTIYKSSSSHGVSLEVSSAIVTSLNGHRDLEIKFFSSSPSAATAADTESFLYPNFVQDADPSCEEGDTKNNACDPTKGIKIVNVQ